MIPTPGHADRSQALHAAAAAAGLAYAPFVGVNGADIDVEAFRTRGVMGNVFPGSWRGTAAVALSHVMLLEELLDRRMRRPRRIWCWRTT